MRTLNLPAAAVLVAVLLVSGLGAHWLHGHQVERHALGFLREAERASDEDWVRRGRPQFVQVLPGTERGKDWTGIHHIGFEVENLEEIAQKLAAAGATPRDDINQALGLGLGARPHGNAEFRYSGPDGVTFDVSQAGWVGTERRPRKTKE